MDCTNCTFDKQCRDTKACKATSFDREEVVLKYSEESAIVKAAASLVDFGRAGTLSRLQETIAFANQMNYKRIGLAYCYGMEKEVQLIADIIRNNGLNVRAVSCTIGGIPQNEVTQENVDLVLMIGLCMGHDILFQREVKIDCTTLVVKDRVFNHAPLKEITDNQKN